MFRVGDSKIIEIELNTRRILLYSILSCSGTVHLHLHWHVLAGIEQLEGLLSLMDTRLGGIVSKMSEMRALVDEPHARIAARISQLARMQRVCERLAALVRFVRLVRRVRKQWPASPSAPQPQPPTSAPTILALNKTRELGKAAQSWMELKTLVESEQLRGVELVARDAGHVLLVGEQLRDAARRGLDDGLRTHNLALLGVSISALNQLHLLWPSLAALLDAKLAEWRQLLRVQLEMRALTDATPAPAESVRAATASATPTSAASAPGPGPGRVANLPAAGSGAAFRARLWLALERVFAHWLECGTQLSLLARPDPTRTSLLESATASDLASADESSQPPQCSSSSYSFAHHMAPFIAPLNEELALANARLDTDAERERERGGPSPPPATASAPSVSSNATPASASGSGCAYFTHAMLVLFLENSKRALSAHLIESARQSTHLVSNLL